MFTPFFLHRTSVPLLQDIFKKNQTVAFHPDVHKISYVQPERLKLVCCGRPLQKFTDIPFDIDAIVFMLTRYPKVRQFIIENARSYSQEKPILLLCGGTTIDDAKVPYIMISPSPESDGLVGSTGIESTKLKNAYQLVYIT